MKVVILCGGMGTRLREETEYKPKPLLDVGGRPILWHIMKLYAHHGFKEFALCLGYRGEMIKEYFLNFEAINSDFTISLGGRPEVTYHNENNGHDFTVTLADTGNETMTGGRIRRISRHLDGDTFMVTYGDGLSNVDITRLLECHRSHGRLATVTVVRPLSRFGVPEVDEAGEVVEFREKPVMPGWVNAGFFVFDRRVLDYLGGDDCVLEREPLGRLAAERQLMAYRHDGFFYCIDTYREHVVANNMWLAGDAPWAVWR
ncbi:MAG: glucose-1-phosphate cytidylyltransferase [Phycisphaerae bacterium]